MRTTPMRQVAFTLIELLVVIAVILILASLTMPVVSRAMKQAAVTQCQSNLGQIGKATLAYALSSKQYTPCYGGPYASEYRPTAIAPHWHIYQVVREEEVFVCPADETPDNCWWWTLNHFTLTKSSYMWNEHLMTWQHGAVPLSRIREPKDVGLAADGWACPNGWTWRTCVPPNRWPPEAGDVHSRVDWEHDGTCNMLYCDWRVERLTHREVWDVRSDPR